MKSYEFLCHFQDTSATIDVSAFVEHLNEDVEYVKLRLNSFAFSITNSGVADSLKVSLSTNIYSPRLLGSNAPANNLYTTVLYLAAGATGTANDVGQSPLCYVIVHKNDLRTPLRLNWTITPSASGVGAISQAYAMLSLLPM